MVATVARCSTGREQLESERPKLSAGTRRNMLEIAMELLIKIVEVVVQHREEMR